MNRINTAEEMVRSYHKEMKSIRMMRVLTMVVFLVLLWVLRAKVNITLAVVFVLVLFLGLQFLQTLQTKQFAMVQRVLNVECDATKYVSIMELLVKDAGKEEAVMKLFLAQGQYYSGRFEEALETLNSFYMARPSAEAAALYHSIAFNCHIELETLEKARSARQEMEAILYTTGTRRRGSISHYLPVMDALLALKEERYDAFFSQQVRMAEETVMPLQKVAALYYLAQGELVQGEDAAAREHLEQVLELGCTTFMAAEAANLLEEFALPE